jgi:hypothetical protein
VKSLYLHAGSSERPQPRTQFASGAVRVGERQNSIGGVIALCDSIGNSMRDGAGLTRAGSGQNAGWSDQRLGSKTLLIIEIREQIFCQKLFSHFRLGL